MNTYTGTKRERVAVIVVVEVEVVVNEVAVTVVVLMASVKYRGTAKPFQFRSLAFIIRIGR